MTEFTVNSRGLDWWSAITQTTCCWLATLKPAEPDTIVCRTSDDPTDLQELLASHVGRKH